LHADNATTLPSFLAGGGEMAAIIAAHDWSGSLGPVAAWPQSLKTATALMIHSPVPMVLLWGPDGIMLYNKAYAGFAGNRHPGLLGAKVLEGWPEAAELNARVMQVGMAGGTLEYKDLELALNRRGQPEPGWMDLFYSPVLDESGRPGGVIAVVVETTERVLAERAAVAQRERLAQMFQDAPSFMCQMEGPEHVFTLTNAAYQQLIGHRDVLGKPIRAALPEIEGQGFFELLDQLYASGESYRGNGVRVQLQRAPGAPTEERMVDFIYQPMRDAAGTITGIFTEGVDVTESRKAEQRRAALVDLSDRIRDIDDPDELAYAGAEILGRALGVSRAGYGTVDPVAESITIARDWNAPGIASLAGVLQFRDYGSYIEDLKRGETVLVTDAFTDPRTAPTAEALKAISAQSFVNMPVSEDGGLVALLYLNHETARDWPAEELSFIREVAERIRTAVERRRAEARLARNEERLRLALSAANSVGTWDWDVAADRVVANAGFATLYGVDPARADTGAPIGEFFRGIHADDVARVQADVARAMASGEAFSSEYRLAQPDGSERWVIAEGRCTLSADGRPLRFSGLSFDITRRKNAEIRREALVRLTDIIRDIGDPNELAFAASTILGETLKVSRVSFGTIDPDAETLTVERDWLAPGVESLEGTLNLRDYGSFIDSLKAGALIAIPDVDKDPRTAGAAQALRRRSAAAFVNVPVLEKGRLVAVLFLNNAQTRAWPAEELAFIQEVAERTRTVMERRRAEAELRASEAQFRTMAQAMPNHVWTAAPDGGLDWLNDRTYDYAGAMPGTLLGNDWITIVHPDDLAGAGAAWGAALQSGRPYETEFRLRRGDGQWRWHIARAVPVRGASGAVTRWVGTNTDIQDQKEIAAALEDLAATLESRVQERTAQLQHAEEALRQSQKMEAVGQLTGGIAHDFNNLLQGITGALDRVQHRIGEGRYGDVERFLKAAVDSANRAAALTHRLLAFSRRQTLDPRPLDANRLIGGMEELVRRTMGPNITVEVVGAAGLWPVRADPSQLENSLLNLCINARDAMPEGGKLTIETANKWLDDRAARDRELPPGQYVSLCVTDTGAGMTPEVISRAFDPFFTTKPLGQGTGLGLSMIYGFVRQSGGQVRIYSEVGKGTTMCLYFPRHFGKADEEDSAVSEAVERGFGETVLVVDDEATVRMLIAEVLSENYYNIIEAGDGPAAVKILETDRRIDLMITDVGLPGGMNGRQVADAARVARPGLKVLFITGYAENAAVANGHLDAGMEILAKPFAMSTLANKVREMIES
jgi:PAS domain S-box-containing protein